MQTPYKYADETPFPHIKSKITTGSIMYDVFLALIPGAAAGVFYFGTNALLSMVITSVTCIITEYVWQRGTGSKVSIKDGSAAVSGLLLAMSLPSEIPYILLVSASIFAIIVGKQVFGGIGNNFLNPALAGRAMIMVLWPGHANNFYGKSVMGGTYGLFLLAGFIYLLVKKRVGMQATVSYLLSVLLTLWIFGQNTADLVGTGLLLGAFFMVTDYSSGSVRGKVWFGMTAGLLTGLISIGGNYREGIYVGILIANCLAPFIDKCVKEHVYGTK